MNPDSSRAVDEIEVVISRMGYGGDGIGRLPDGRAVFVPFVLPGERVRAQPVETRRNFIRARLLEVLEASPDRIAPPCIHFGTCGGCHYQHIPYPRQLALKQDILREQLERIGGFSDPPVHPTIPSPSEWNYRNHIQFHLTGDGKLGYYTLAGDRVFAVQECLLPEEPIRRTWPRLDFEAIPEIERIGLRAGAGEDIQLTLEGSDPHAPEMSLDLPISAAYLGPGGQVILAGDEALIMEVRGRAFQVSPGSFFQVNTALAEAMVGYLLDQLPLSPEMVLVDLYCGVGLFSAFLAPRVRQVIGVEISEQACADFAANLDEFENVVLYQGPAEQVLPALDARPDGIIVDPPRAGLERKALDSIVALGAPALAYVSCDPATLARDAKRLVEMGYRLVHATPFDLFPQTYHIESISLFSK